MRTIKFRGQRVDIKEWVYGGIAIAPDESVIILTKEEQIVWHVIPETVGQFTGLTDRNGVDIYEGDLLKDVKYPVTYEDGSFCATFEYDLVRCWLNSDDCNLETLEVIGNIHETK
jgi:uncharacterized phage protein (TIGR01671 family)